MHEQSLNRVPIAAPLEPEDLVVDQAVSGPDQDKFRHEVIAARIADIVANAALPVNLAVFAPWGAGKTGLAELIAGDLAGREGRNIAFVRYDAWRFGGHSLRRNFISDAARALRFGEDRYREFYAGLYETKRRAELRLSPLRRELLSIGFWFLVLFASFTAVLALVIGASNWLTDLSFVHEIRKHLGRYLAPSGAAAFLLAAGKTIFETGRVDIEQGAPSDEEEFSGTFRELVTKARHDPYRGVSARSIARRTRRRFRRRRLRTLEWVRQLRQEWERGDNWRGALARLLRRRQTRALGAVTGRGRTLRFLVARAAKWRRVGDETGPPYERLVFFIDELDRCTRKEVVETLVTLRTFLDAKHCAFIVAADRAVLVEALDDEVPQETPINEDTPYYSTAGAFLDKIFQHQLSLPPLRGRSLLRFARDLVADRSKGIWHELNSAGDGLLDRVLYALIPAHIRSPRRVKVLLNNFAANARIAQSRGIEWPRRASPRPGGSSRGAGSSR